MSEATYIITHIPKTAGSSLRVHFQSHLEDQVEFIHLANRGHNKASRLSMQPFQQRQLTSRNLAKVIFGHQVNHSTKQLVSDKTVIEAVVFRTPKDWEISRYNQYAYAMSRDQSIHLSFTDWCDSNKVNKLHSQFDWFLEHYLKVKARTLATEQRDALLIDTLKHFKYILFVEDFPACLEPIFDDLNISAILQKNTNVVGLDKPNLFKQNPTNKQLLTRICARDTETYKTLYSSFGLQ